MGINSPAETADIWINNGVKKAGLPIGKMIVLGMLAGVYIGFGACVFVQATAAGGDAFQTMAAKLIGASLFPVGLMMVVLCGAELFTGNCLMITGLLDRKFSFAAMMRNWAVVYVGNFVGSILMVLMISCSGLLESGAGALGALVVKTAVSKCSLTFGKAFVLGILCNWMVCLAVWMATGAQNTIGKIFAIWFCIGLFIVSGFEHSVANMYFIPAGLMAAGNDAFVQLAGVDVSGLSFGAFLIKNLLPVTLGNIVGGSFFVGMFYWVINRK